MNRFISIVIASFCISGCVSIVMSPSSEDIVASLKKDYESCLMRTGNDSTQCVKEKDRLLQEEKWQDLELYGS